jgi:NYN domain
MFRRRIRSALYIDFENVPVDPRKLANIIAWLEDGLFDDQMRRRRIISRQVYWNSQAQRHADTFKEQRFTVVLCEKYGHNMKNGADIRIAIDMVEATNRTPKIEEFILFSRDSDFVPLIQRLGAKDKATVVLVDEHQQQAHTAYSLHADQTIPHRILIEQAQHYRRTPPRLLARLWWPRLRPTRELLEPRHAGPPELPRPAHQPLYEPAGQPTSPVVRPLPSAPVKTDARSTPPIVHLVPAVRKPQLDQAVDVFIRVASRTPGQPTGRQAITKQLTAIAGFSNSGGAPYFGFKSYHNLAAEVTRRDPRLGTGLWLLGCNVGRCIKEGCRIF